jgi:hypothetical protein
MSRASDLLALANLNKRDRYIDKSIAANFQQKRDWKWVGYDSTTGQGVVQSGNLIRRGKVITNGAIVPGEIVSYSQDGEFGIIEGKPYVRPNPQPKPQYVPKREFKIHAWAIVRSDLFDSYSYSIMNLITGGIRILGIISKTVRPCAATVPPDFPDIPPTPPIDPSGQLYQHIFAFQTWTTSPSPTCSPFPPFHPQNFGSTPTSTRFNMKASADGTEWTYRQEFKYDQRLPDGGDNWASNTLVTVTRSPTPPTINPSPLGYAVIGSSTTSSVWPGTYVQVGAFAWVHVSTSCPPYNQPDSPAPPLDNRNPNGTPIPNTIETSLSIGADRVPIALIRHNPNCVNPVVWNYERSFRMVMVGEDPAVMRNTAPLEYPGRLTTDWRYGQTFNCRDTFRSENFSNFDVSGDGRTTLWSIEPPDRPAVIVANAAPVPVNVTEKSLDQLCAVTAFPAAIDKFNAISLDFSGQLEVVNIAVLIEEE